MVSSTRNLGDRTDSHPQLGGGVEFSSMQVPSLDFYGQAAFGATRQ